MMNQNIESVHPVGDGELDLPADSPGTWLPLVALGFYRNKYLYREAASREMCLVCLVFTFQFVDVNVCLLLISV